MRDVNDGGNDSGTDFVGEPLDDVLIELDDVGLQADQHVERGVASAQVIQGDLAAAFAVVAKDVLEMVQVADVLTFGHLEHELLHPEPGELGGPFGGRQAHLGPVDRGGQEVHEQQVLAEPGPGPT